MAEPKSHVPALRALGIALFASPAAVAFLLSRGHRHAAAVRAAALLLTLATAALLVTRAWRWQLISGLWGLLSLVGALVLAVLLRAPAPEPSGVEGAWARRTLWMIVPLAAAVPCLLTVARLLGWVLWEDLLVRFNPRAIDPSDLFLYLVLDSLWAVPAAIVFVALSFRRARLLTVRDVALAVGSWTAVLWLQEVIVLGSFGALRSQMIGAEGFSDIGEVQHLVLKLSLGIAIVPLVLYLAWGTGPWLRRLGAAAVLVLAAFLHLGILTGLNARVQFVIGRSLDRGGHVEAALAWYGRSLVTNSNAHLTSYLQHRIGLLQYLRGNEERAAAAFRLAATTHNESEDLARESAYFLERLADEPEGERVVIDDISVQTELREAYCAPNTLALVFRYWDRPVSVREIGEQVALIGSGTSTSDSRFLAESLGLELHFHPFATLDDLRWLIDRGIPALVFTPGHVLSVFGYDDRLGTVVTYDTATWDIWVDRPVLDLLEEWGERNFQLGVMLPRDETSEAAMKARQRYAGPRSEAFWWWTLYWEEPSGVSAEEELLRRAVLADPTFFPAPFELLRYAYNGRTDFRKWLDEQIDTEILEAEARGILERPHAPVMRTSEGLAYLWWKKKDYAALLELAEDLDGRAELTSTVAVLAGRAAAKLDQPQKAAFWLGEKSGDLDDLDRWALRDLAEAQIELDRADAAAETLTTMSASAQGDLLDRVVELAEEIAQGRGPDFLETIYARVLSHSAADIKLQLRFAELSLAADELDPSARRERLHRARRAATIARAMAPDPESAARAADLLATIEAKRKAMTARPEAL